MGKRQLTIRIPGPMPSDPWTEIVVAEEFVLNAYSYVLHKSGERQLAIQHTVTAPFHGLPDGVGVLRMTLEAVPLNELEVAVTKTKR